VTLAVDGHRHTAAHIGIVDDSSTSRCAKHPLKRQPFDLLHDECRASDAAVHSFELTGMQGISPLRQPENMPEARTAIVIRQDC